MSPPTGPDHAQTRAYLRTRSAFAAAQARRQAEAAARAPKQLPVPPPLEVLEAEPPRDWRGRLTLVFASVVAIAVVGAIVLASRNATTRPMIVSPPGTPTTAAITPSPPTPPAPPARQSCPAPSTRRPHPPRR